MTQIWRSAGKGTTHRTFHRVERRYSTERDLVDHMLRCERRDAEPDRSDLVTI
jgi:hypothetical protein